MNRVIAFAAVGEVVTGLALVIVPSLVGRLLLGAELIGAAIPIARILGFALIGLGIACWPGPPRRGMLAYSSSAACYLAYLGFVGGFAGMFLWPAVILHAILAALLARATSSRTAT